MVDADLMKYLTVAIFAFGAENIARMIGKGEFVPYIRIGCTVAVLTLAFTDIKSIMAIMKTFQSM